MPKQMWDKIYKDEIFVEKFNPESEEWFSLGVSEFIKFHNIVKQNGWKMIYLARKDKLATTLSYTTARKNKNWLGFYNRYEQYNHKDYKLIEHWYDLQHIYAKRNNEKVHYYEEIFSNDIEDRISAISNMDLNLTEYQIKSLAKKLTKNYRYYQPKSNII